MIPIWTWVPAGVTATALALLGVPAAPVAGLALALVATALNAFRRRPPAFS
ncbi:hypothetical protein [Streptosporangium sp. H16]|uniref:hypothetical protein n=1 Tax=Streptosporangium sp. H16 TaxID=3444184 RepID=UPI003F796786